MKRRKKKSKKEEKPNNFKGLTSRCLNCGEDSYHLTPELTKAKCDHCGFELDLEKVPFLKGITNILKNLRGAIKFPIDAKDLKLDNTEEEQ